MDFMNLTDIAPLRLINQQIKASKFKTAKEIVGWLGAMQAQDFNMAKWAIGVRLPNSTDKLIESAIDQGEIIRTHLMRPTWHFVSSDDIYWMLSLTAPQIKASLRSRNKELELTEIIYEKSNSIIENALQGGKHLFREELVAGLEQANIATDNNRASHLLLGAELDGIICSGKKKNNKITYALLSERVAGTKTFTRDEALAQLAQKYFTSHGPATIQDFVWWSGLSVNESRHALEMIKSNLVSETIDHQTFWFTNPIAIPKLEKDSIYLLPTYDEFIINYKDRTASLPLENFSKAVSNNGIFRPTIVINGQVKGLWKRTIKKDKIILETEFFQLVDKSIIKLIEKAVVPYEIFMNKKVEMA
jgi:hypothetical protein